MVANVTAGWAANANWKLGEMLRRYPDAEATMGDGRRVGKIGPDAAGRLLSPTTVKVRSFSPRSPSSSFVEVPRKIEHASHDHCLPLFISTPLAHARASPPPPLPPTKK